MGGGRTQGVGVRGAWNPGLWVQGFRSLIPSTRQNLARAQVFFKPYLQGLEILGCQDLGWGAVWACGSPGPKAR